MKNKVAVHWFRQDLRVKDNPSLNYLSKKYENIIGLFVFDDVNRDPRLGSASKVWLCESLKHLNEQLNGNLILLKGDPQECLEEILNFFDVEEVSWNRCYEPWVIKRDKKIKSNISEKIKVSSFNGSLLWEPWEILKDDNTPYKVFTPFYKRGCLSKKAPRNPETSKINFFNHNFRSTNICDLQLLQNKEWESQTLKIWQVGEAQAEKIMKNFLEEGIKDYSDGRNFPKKKNVSRLSPFLHWGQISPNTIWHALSKVNDVGEENIEVFKSELGWREFAYYLNYHFPYLQKENLKKNFDNFKWKNDEISFQRWTKGETGIPIVDAGMRELYQTGYMHNRSRMIVGSFLVKNLLIHWKKGEEWFWDCLFDADAASNSASWQWIAGTGTDSTPYFRIFNPVTQGQKFDPEGQYIKKFVPELNDMPIKYLFSPWECPENIQNEINFKLGVNYPNPIVDLKESRKRALLTYEILRRENSK